MEDGNKWDGTWLTALSNNDPQGAVLKMLDTKEKAQIQMHLLHTMGILLDRKETWCNNKN